MGVQTPSSPSGLLPHSEQRTSLLKCGTFFFIKAQAVRLYENTS